MIDVFITDGHQRKAIPVVRALGREGLKVAIGGESTFSPAFFSKYCFQRIKYPSAAKDPKNFLDFIRNFLRENRPKVFMPLDEWTLDVVTKHLEELSKYSKIPIPSRNIYLKARDKAQTLKIAQDVGIPCPKTYLPRNIDEVQALYRKLKAPLVIKPRLSSGSRGIIYVKYINHLIPKYMKIHSQYPNPIIQEFILPGGDTYGAEVLMNKDSEPRAVFVHRRLREYPVNGGPSTLRESVDYPELVEMGVKLLRALNWFGVAMVEFKIDPRDGTPKLMEINPKFWGSIQLPIVSGVNFPYLLYKLAIEGDIEPIREYKAGVMCRWLLPGDILNFLSNKNRFKLNPSFFKFRDENIYYDILSKDDPGPVLGAIFYHLWKILSPNSWGDLMRR